MLIYGNLTVRGTWSEWKPALAARLTNEQLPCFQLSAAFNSAPNGRILI